MMRTAVALLVSVSMLGCFPHNAKHRTYAKYAEGGALVGGIVISAIGNTGADCDQMEMLGGADTNCKRNAQILSTVGVALILGGLLGFVATVSTAEDDDSKPVVTAVPEAAATGKSKTDAKPASTDGAGSGSDGAGSASTGPAAPQLQFAR